MGFFQHFNHRLRPTVTKADTGDSGVVGTPAKALQEAHRRAANEDSNRGAMGTKPMSPEEYKLRFNAHLADVYAEAKANAHRYPASQFAKTESVRTAPDGLADGFNEAHRRTREDASNLNAAGTRSMTDDEYKIRFAGHLSAIHAESKANNASVRFGTGTSGPRDDGQGKSNAENPASTKTASGPRDDGSTHRSTQTTVKTPKAIQAPPERGAGRIRKQAIGAPIDLSNPLHVATGMRVRTR